MNRQLSEIHMVKIVSRKGLGLYNNLAVAALIETRATTAYYFIVSQLYRYSYSLCLMVYCRVAF